MEADRLHKVSGESSLRRTPNREASVLTGVVDSKHGFGNGLAAALARVASPQNRSDLQFNHDPEV